jgi:hypothetical protein
MLTEFLNKNENITLKSSINSLTANITFKVIDDLIYLSNYSSDSIKNDIFININKDNFYKLDLSFYSFYNNFIINNKSEKLFEILNDSTQYLNNVSKNTSSKTNKSFKYKTSLIFSNTLPPSQFIIFYSPKLSNIINSNGLDDNLIKYTLKDSEIVFNSGENFNSLLNYISTNAPEQIFKQVDNKLEFNIINFNGYREIKTIDIPSNTIDDTFIYNYFKTNKYISPKIFNFEFYFDTEYNTAYLFGAFFNKDQISILKFNKEDINSRFNLNIKDLDFNSNNSYEIKSDNNHIILPYSYINENNFNFNIIETGSDYGFYNNLEECTTYPSEIISDTDGEYSYVMKTEYETVYGDWIPKKYTINNISPGYKSWIDEYGFITNYNIDKNFITNDLFVISDKNGNFYNINNFYFDNQNIEIIKPFIDFNNFIDILPSNKSANYKELNSYSDNNIIFSFEDLKNDNRYFNLSDYIEINVYNQRFRLIANSSKCCSKSSSGELKDYILEIDSCKFNFERSHNSIIGIIAIDGFHRFEEGNIVYLTTEYFKNIEFEIIRYEYKNGVSYIYVLDYNGEFFYKCKSIKNISIKYIQKSFNYRYFDNTDTLNNVMNSIVNEINNFNTTFLKAYIQQNKIIIVTPNETFARIRFNFNNLNFDSSKFKINDIFLQNITYYDDFGEPIFSRNRTNWYYFSGGNIINKNSRFSILKDWAIENLNGNEIIFNNNKWTRLKSFNFGSSIKNYSNYLEEPIKVKNEIVEFEYLNDFVVLDIDNNNNFSQSSNTGLIDFYYEFFPNIYKLIPTKYF